MIKKKTELFSSGDKYALAADVLLVAISIIAGLALYFTASFSYGYPLSYSLCSFSGLIVVANAVRFISQNIPISDFTIPAAVEKQHITHYAPAMIPIAQFRPVVDTLPKSADEEILQCPDDLQLFYALAPKESTNQILRSLLYTHQEKKLVFEAAHAIYLGEQVSPSGIFPQQWRCTLPNDWVWEYVTMYYLNQLSILYPYFKTFSRTFCSEGQADQLVFSKFSITQVIKALPDNLADDAPYLLGHALAEDDHRTGFLIDLRGCTVEYWNGFGNDEPVSAFFNNLAERLTKKYGKKFNYTHRTQGIHLQKNNYDCGIWICKFLEERILQDKAIENGKSFNFRTCQSGRFNIKIYRKIVYDKAFEFLAYFLIGDSRFKLLPNEVVEENFMISTTDCYHWGKTGKIPKYLDRLLSKAHP